MSSLVFPNYVYMQLLLLLLFFFLGGGRQVYYRESTWTFIENIHATNIYAYNENFKLQLVYIDTIIKTNNQENGIHMFS